jgi:hypothetical protein
VYGPEKQQHILATPLGKKDLVSKTTLCSPSQMGSRCELDMNNIVTASMEDLTMYEEQKYHALQEYMKVQFLVGVKNDHHGKVARLEEFELLAIRLNDNKVEIVPTVSKPPPTSSSQKSLVDSDEFLASYIAHLEYLEDLEKDRNIAYNNNETSSSAPKIYPHGVYPGLAPLL